MSQKQRYSKVESWVQGAIGINPNDPTYASYRHSSKTGIEMGLVIAGGYGLVKNALGSRIIIKNIGLATRKATKFQGQINKISSGLETYLEEGSYTALH